MPRIDASTIAEHRETVCQRLHAGFLRAVDRRGDSGQGEAILRSPSQ